MRKCQTSQPVGSEKDFLESHGQVLVRTGDETECQTSFLEDPAVYATLEVKAGTFCCGGCQCGEAIPSVTRQLVMFHVLVCKSPSVIVTKSPHDIHTESLWQTFLTSKVRSFSIKMKKDKQHCFGSSVCLF